MNDILKKYSSISKINNEFTVYDLDQIKQDFEVQEITENSWIVLNWDQDRFWLKFAILEYSYSNSDKTNIKTGLLFHGGGPSKTLGECRHTWWGEENGYIFYPNGPTIIGAFKILSQYFDDMI